MTLPNSKDNQLSQLKLGKATEYKDQYDASLLQGVPRQLMRETLPLNESEFIGYDIWTAFELSWLNTKGKPQVAIAEVYFSPLSVNLVESKSFKLYLNSFNQTQITDLGQLKSILETDLSQVSLGTVEVHLEPLASYAQRAITPLKGHSLDALDITITNYQYNPDLLCLADGAESRPPVNETLCSDLFKSNCLVTGQPDWASIEIAYQGAQIDHSALLKYIISFRNHNEFHEHCVERIYCDILNRLKPDKLSVYARFTRRGGLDINPIRVSDKALLQRPLQQRSVRQ